MKYLTIGLRLRASYEMKPEVSFISPCYNVINKDYGVVSTARNRGLEEASGD